MTSNLASSTPLNAKNPFNCYHPLQTFQPGSLESFNRTIKEDSFDKMIYFGVTAVDGSVNESPMSNIVSVFVAGPTTTTTTGLSLSSFFVVLFLYLRFNFLIKWASLQSITIYRQIFNYLVLLNHHHMKLAKQSHGLNCWKKNAPTFVSNDIMKNSSNYLTSLKQCNQASMFI